MNKIQEQIETDIDESGDAIRAAIKASAELSSLSTKQADALNQLDTAVLTLLNKRFFSEGAEHDKLVKLSNRIRRLRELRNSAEMGSFSLEVANAMNEAFRHLP